MELIFQRRSNFWSDFVGHALEHLIDGRCVQDENTARLAVLTLYLVRLETIDAQHSLAGTQPDREAEVAAWELPKERVAESTGHARFHLYRHPARFPDRSGAVDRLPRRGEP